MQGIVRGVMDYGCFVELAPNLSGLTDRREDLQEGDGVSVTIRSIRPERMKIKLQVIEVLPPAAAAGTAALLDHRRGAGSLGLLPCQL